MIIEKNVFLKEYTSYKTGGMANILLCVIIMMM